MKYLIPIILMLITACGGSESRTDDPIIVEPPNNTDPILYHYKVTISGNTQFYEGEGVKIGETIYLTPNVIADSSFVVIGEITNDDVRLFSYVSRTIVADFTDGDLSGYDLELTEIGILPKADIGSLTGEWFNQSFDGLFGDDVVVLVNDNGDLSGTDSTGCNISGQVNESDGVFAIELTLIDCVTTGFYSGSLRFNGTVIIGALTSNDYGIMLSYEVK